MSAQKFQVHDIAGTMQVYVRLSERLGLSDHLLVLNVMLSKIATNLKVYGSCDEVITLTLGLFQVQSPACSRFTNQLFCVVSLRHLSEAVGALQDLAAGYMSGKLLLKLEATAFILQHHTAEHFAFLDDPANSRSRTSFYCTLARLLFMEDTPAKFKSFVAPLQQVPHCTCLTPCHHVTLLSASIDSSRLTHAQYNQGA